jgi:glutamine amidotransferase
MNVAIVKYNAGNIRSVTYALNRLGIEPCITDEPESLKSADKVIFPGVGEASTAMRYLKDRNLDMLIPELKQPVLGICLGLQLMCASSEEGSTNCLGIFPNQVKQFRQAPKVPHMGWNTLEVTKQSDLFQHIDEGAHLYYVHSYYAEVASNTLATTTYGETFSAILNKENFYAIQAHPEKSSTAGEQLLKNFLSLNL